MAVGERSHDGHLVAVLVLAEILAASPGVSAIGRFEDAVSGEVQSVIVVGRDQYGGIPIEPVFLFTWGRLGLDRAALVCLGLQPVSVAALRFGVDHGWIKRVYLSIEPVAAADSIPLIVADSLDGKGAAWAGPASVVLKAAVDPVWLLVIEGDLIELAERYGVDVLPALASIISKVYSAIGTDDHVVGI